jgi:hypothetical protein
LTDDSTPSVSPLSRACAGVKTLQASKTASAGPGRRQSDELDADMRLLLDIGVEELMAYGGHEDPAACTGSLAAGVAPESLRRGTVVRSPSDAKREEAFM